MAETRAERALVAQSRTRAKRVLVGRSRATFLRWVAAGLSITEAAELAGVSRRTVYDRRRRDPRFADAWAIAEMRAIDRKADEFRRIAMSDPLSSRKTVDAMERFFKLRGPSDWGARDRPKVPRSPRRRRAPAI